jgi:acyl transferase domain-containing protein
MNSEYDIAIVGMAGRFPGARNLDEFWRNLAGGVESITRLSDEEMLEAGVPESHLRNPNYVKAGPVLDKPGHFDAEFFGFSPMEARMMDPQHRILLELAHEALEHAGYDTQRYQGRVGVFTGAAMNTYFMNVGLGRRFAEEYIPTLIGNDKDFLSTRISYKLNLKGPSITVQTACSSSMVAVHLARQSLLSEETDIALAGAISVRVPDRAGYFYDGGGVVSPDGHVRAFDAKANGTVFGSGGGILVLKRLADAVADGDTIHAVIKGSAVNNDGSEKAGYTAPSVNSQADAVVEALANAGINADSVSYVEAHGSGTPVGDPIEVSALTKAFRSSTERSGYCALGSVKTNVGHLDAAAAVTGIIKTVLALKHRQLPPSLHFTEANPAIDFPSTPFYVNTELREWSSHDPRRAAVISTGMGGTNACVVLEEARVGRGVFAEPAPQLLILSARTETALDRAADQLREFLTRDDSVNLGDVAYTLQIGRKAFPYRRYGVCAHGEDTLWSSSSYATDLRRPVILLLPGIGDQYAGMAYDLYEEWSIFREEVDRCAEILRPYLGVDIRSILYPKDQSWKQQPTAKGIDLKKMLGRKTDAPLNETLFAQPALFTIEYAMARLWQSLGVTPDAIVGHSMGEYVAACLAGVLSLEDALRLIATRARLVNELPQGAMLAVTLAENDLLPLLPEDLSISLINGPRLCVVAGPVAGVAQFEKSLSAKGILCRHVQNAHAFHSKMLDPIVKAFEEELKTVPLKEPVVPYISNVTGTWIRPGEATNSGYWAMHATRTARFSDALREVWQFKNPILMEAGPGRTLGVLAMQHPERNGGDPVVVSSIRHDYETQSDVEFLLHAMGKLWFSGAEIKWENLHRGERRRRVPLPTYPFERQHHWLEPVRISEAARPSNGFVHKNPNPSEWLYVPSWKRLLPARIDSSHLESGRRWLVFADSTGFASDLIAKLRAAGQEVVIVTPGRSFQQVDSHTFVIEPANPEEYDSLIQCLQANHSLPQRVVHAWSVTASSQGNTFSRTQDLGLYGVLFLVKALAAHKVEDEIHLFVLSNNVQEVCGTEILCPEKSTILAPCMVIRQEYPNIRTKSIDLDLRGDRVADLVFGEIANADSSLFVAYRNGHRWVQTYEPVVLPDGRPLPSTFRKRGVYLITGGLGKVGLAISEYLARNYHPRLALVGRSSRPSDTDAIQKLERLGAEVLYLSANVADAKAMRNVLEQVYGRFGPLHGVIHGAGIVGDDGYREIKDSDQENCDGHFQAKAHGVCVLEEILDGKALDFCLLLSSLTSVLGGIGQAAYAASNIYMDAFVRRHNRSSSVPWLSVNWDIWRVLGGMPSQSDLGTTLKDLGMSTSEAMATMESALRLRHADQLVVSTGDLNARIDQWIKLESLDARPKTIGQAANTRIPKDPPRDETEETIARIWQETLGIDSVGIHDNFAQLGGHSLLAIRIVSELRKAFQIDLTIRVLFDSPTVAELSTYIKEQLTAEIEALSDAEAQQLVSA